MQFQVILTAIALALGLALPAAAASTKAKTRVKPDQDALITDMAEAYKKPDNKRLAALLPQVQGHVLEPWAAYWELSARLEDAKPAEVENFLSRYAGTYQEDRLRNDWLLQLGKRRDWTRFTAELPRYRMGDDVEVRCHALHAAYATSNEDVAAQVQELWLAQRDPDDGCAAAAERLIKDEKLDPMVAWRRARLGFEFDKPRIAQQAISLLNPDWANGLNILYTNPKRYLDEKLTAFRPKTREWVTLAMIRLASSDPEAAAEEVSKLRWRAQLTQEERSWVWGVIGKRAARTLSDKALSYYANGQDMHMHSDHLVWKVRAALRANDWQQVHDSIAALSESQMRDPTWIYWRARALLALQATNAELRARTLLQSIASPRGFYEQLAMEELGQRISAPAAPAPLSEEELQAARDNEGLKRALHAIGIGLRTEGVREWNYSTNLHQRGGMSDRELLAAAAVACELHVWDRCINASERTRTVIDVSQRFPTPFKQEVQQRASSTGLEPAFVYGLIRQESRFIPDAKSGVGAAGLMQVMPATARWTARRIGMNNFKPKQITERDTNIAIGTGYLKLVLDAFDGSMPLAAAAYNAGPSRSKVWRGQTGDPVLEAAIWTENIPFGETRDYVKKVLSNTVNYAAVLTGEPQSLKARLGFVGPLGMDKPEPAEELP
ncbi:lytic transglycosylase domain-containing protein [Curvibacter sp. PAE-UM]|uniref:lytic transglycosylase domain-containing protein n=1 Tax=Curvibacter sp. PAE-UM TaxID=1714344 RepID=UPI00070C5408|nr:lytic transglycosylase domain-containing protein [Curvibacter sp. PAE-UM]KRH99037.1 lytic transglycosylase [Curvibacter sp. PAE-UM]